MDSIFTRREFISLGVGFIGSITFGGCYSFNNMKEKMVVSKTDIYKDGIKRVIVTNQFPNHPTGDFPNENCPYAVGYSEKLIYEIPLNPQKAKNTQSIYDHYVRFGIALNGIPFDPAGPSWDKEGNWHFEVLSPVGKKYLGIDINNAHVQPYDRPNGPKEKYGEIITMVFLRCSLKNSQV